MRIADHLLSHDIMIHCDTMPCGRRPTDIVKLIADAYVFHIDNVAEYIFNGTPQEHWTRSDFPDVRPPFPITFFDYRVPRTANVEGRTVALAGDERTECADLLLCDDEIVLVYRFIRGIDGEVHLFPTVSRYWLEDERAIETSIPNDVMEGVDHWQGMRLNPGNLSPTLFALGLLSCKNVAVVEHTPPPKLNKKRGRRGHAPLMRWHTLEIGPVTAALDRAKADTGGDIKQALHVCRGHFKTFDRRPLFGRVTGRFWWTPHARGSLTEGTVFKDYEITRTQRTP